MTVFAKKISPAWRQAFASFEQICGFEVMHQDEIDAGKMTPHEAWKRNVAWLEDVVADVQHIRTPHERG